MRNLRRHLSFANVVACLALFVALGGASYAAVKLPGNSVGTRQIKKNAVKTGKIKSEAVRAGKIAKEAIVTDRLRDGIVSTEKIVDSAVTGAKIDAPSTPFGRIVETLGGDADATFGPSSVYPLASSTYVQPAGRVDLFIGTLSIDFAAGCEPPREVQAYLLVDAAEPLSPAPQATAGVLNYKDESAGDVTRQATFAPVGGADGTTWRGAPSADTPHTFSIILPYAACNNGSTAVSATEARIDVLGTK